MFMIEYKDIGWWYWLVTAGLLTYGVLGNSVGFMLVIGLTMLQQFILLLGKKAAPLFLYKYVFGI